MTYPLMSARAAERPETPQKSPQAFRTISEVAEELDVPAHVLRFWESRFTQIRPLKRGGGRRYYRPADVALLKGIRRLLYEEGMTIKGAQKVMRERGVRFVSGLGTGEEADMPSPVAVAPEAEPEKETASPTDSNGAFKPLLTPEKRASLEAALSLLNDLRSELSEFTGNGRSETAAGECLRKDLI